MMEKPWENYGKMMMMAVVLVVMMMMMMSNIFVQIRHVRGTQPRCGKKTAFGGTFSVGNKDNEAHFYVTCWKTVMNQFFLPEIVSPPV